MKSQIPKNGPDATENDLRALKYIYTSSTQKYFFYFIHLIYKRVGPMMILILKAICILDDGHQLAQ